MNEFYLDLLSGDKTVQDLTDAELKQLHTGWIDKFNKHHPPFPLFTEVRAEERAREAQRASKPLKPIDRGFYS